MTMNSKTGMPVSGAKGTFLGAGTVAYVKQAHSAGWAYQKLTYSHSVKPPRKYQSQGNSEGNKKTLIPKLVWLKNHKAVEP